MQKGYFIIEKVEPPYGGSGYYESSYKYLEVYYNEQTYKDEYRGYSHDIKALVKEVERLLVAVKGNNG